MPLTNVGRNAIAARIISNTTAAAFDETKAYLGVGDGVTVFAVTDANLTGANRLRKPMDAPYPVVLDNAITMQSTFGPDDANWAWQEWGVFNGPASTDVMLSRLVEANSTKLQGQTWILKVTIAVIIGA